MVPAIAGSTYGDPVRFQEEPQYVKDHLVRFETFLCAHILAFFYYLEKAYDTTPKHGILSDLWALGFRGHPPPPPSSLVDFYLTDFLKSG